jgi:hypothetical protein
LPLVVQVFSAERVLPPKPQKPRFLISSTVCSTSRSALIVHHFFDFSLIIVLSKHSESDTTHAFELTLSSAENSSSATP